MAALELHVPQWQIDPAGGRRPPDRLVFDLDPGPGTSIVDCCRVAERLRHLLDNDGLTAFAKTSGSKGMLHRTSHRGDGSQHSSAAS
jgi:bifunctional non-homologous end joining protein LigD